MASLLKTEDPAFTEYPITNTNTNTKIELITKLNVKMFGEAVCVPGSSCGCQSSDRRLLKDLANLTL